MKELFIDYYHSPIGWIQIIATSKYLIEINFCDFKDNKKPNELTKKTTLQLDEYFSGRRREFNLPYQLSGTPFQQKVWKKLIEIPYGTTLSYSEFAKILNKEKAVRAVAHAIGQNHLLILIPCHRILGKNHSLTGYKAGIDKKKYLLDLEYPQ